jgi:polyisoprenoid-binding protein YceI
MAWQIDNSHSHIQFAVRHMMLSKTRGEFQTFSGTLNLDEDQPANSTVEVEIDAASINTRDAQRDAHLRSPDFLDADKYPKLYFKSTRIEQIDGQHAKLYGDLTIRGVTNPVVLDVEFTGKSKSPWGTENYGFEAHTKISRKDWGLTWNAPLETGGVLVSDEVNIDIELEVVKQPEAAPVAEAA